MTQPTQQQIASLFGHGLTIEDIARMFGVCVEEIRKLLADTYNKGKSK